MKAPLEKDIQRTCVQWLELWLALPIRTNSGAVKIGEHFFRFNNRDGCSDFVVCLPDGMFCAIEFKRPGKDATAKQRAFLDMVIARNGLGLVIHSLEELKSALRDEGYDTELPK